MGTHKQKEFERAARAWEAKHPGASVWKIDNDGEHILIRIDNPPRGSGFTHGQILTPEAFSAATGGWLRRFTKAANSC